MKNKTIIFRILITLLFMFLFFYVTLPPINITSMDFWFYLLFIVIVYYGTGIINVINFNNIFQNINMKKNIFKTALIPTIIFGIFALIYLTASITVSWTVPRAIKLIAAPCTMQAIDNL